MVYIADWESLKQHKTPEIKTCTSFSWGVQILDPMLSWALLPRMALLLM